MRKSRKLFQIMFFFGALFFASACTEDETMDELMETIDKYNFENQATDKNDEKPPSDEGG